MLHDVLVSLLQKNCQLVVAAVAVLSRHIDLTQVQQIDLLWSLVVNTMPHGAAACSENDTGHSSRARAARAVMSSQRTAPYAQPVAAWRGVISSESSTRREMR